jgi:hypothetical protein
MKNQVEIAGYAAFGVGLCVTASLVSSGFTADASLVAIAVGLGAFAVSLVCLVVSAMCRRLPPAPAVARLHTDHETSTQPRGRAG